MDFPSSENTEKCMAKILGFDRTVACIEAVFIQRHSPHHEMKGSLN
jgi:hypothetical protein